MREDSCMEKYTKQALLKWDKREEKKRRKNSCFKLRRIKSISKASSQIANTDKT